MDQRKTADFVDELMERAFSLPAPEMPDFASISKEESPLQELKDEELDFLAAAGVSYGFRMYSVIQRHFHRS